MWNPSHFNPRPTDFRFFAPNFRPLQIPPTEQENTLRPIKSTDLADIRSQIRPYKTIAPRVAMAHDQSTHPSPPSDTNESSMGMENLSKTLPSLASQSYLFTPPEHMDDSFSQNNNQPEPAPKLAPLQTLSPPVSPEDKALPHNTPPPPQYPAQDPLLYPDHTHSNAYRADTPLFESESQEPTPVRRKSYSPTEEELRERGNVGDVIGPGVSIEPTHAAVRQYFNDRMAELSRIRQPLPKPTRSESAATRDPVSRAQIHSLNRPAGITKSKPAPRAVAKPKAPKASSSSPTKAAASPSKAAVTPKRRTPKPKASSVEEFLNQGFPQTKHKRAPPSKKVEDSDQDVQWRELPDYCPPVESLKAQSKPLKANWNRQPLDISGTIDLDQLGPEERAVAIDLRLQPVSYLANKRRLFAARLKHLKEGKNWTRTAAQIACKIDVNKTSKLFEAYDRVGWFDEKWFEQWL